MFDTSESLRGLKVSEIGSFTPSEAADRWGIPRNTLNAAINRGKFDKQIEKGLLRKFQSGNISQWSISYEAMKEVYGLPKRFQVVEKWVSNKGDQKRMQFFFFDENLVHVGDHDEIFPDSFFEAVSNAKSYDEARGLVFQFRFEKLKEGSDPQLSIRIEIVNNGNGLLINQTDFFDSIQMDDEFHLASIKETLNLIANHMSHDSKWFGFEFKSTHPFTKNTTSYVGNTYSTVAEFEQFVDRLRDTFKLDI